MAFAIKAEVRDPRATTFAFTARKTMYGGKHIAERDTVFVFASENEGGPGLRPQPSIMRSVLTESVIMIWFPRPKAAMCRLRSVILATVALIGSSASPRALHAQFPAEVGVGARVRVWVPEPYRQTDGPARRQLLRGTVAALTPDTLHLSIPGTVGTVAIPRVTMRRLQVSRGASRPASAIERAVGGAAGGAVSWALLNDPRRTGGPHYRTDWRAAGVGAAWGAGIGALTGLLFPHERWHRVRLRR